MKSLVNDIHKAHTHLTYWSSKILQLLVPNTFVESNRSTYLKIIINLQSKGQEMKIKKKNPLKPSKNNKQSK